MFMYSTCFKAKKTSYFVALRLHEKLSQTSELATVSLRNVTPTSLLLLPLPRRITSTSPQTKKTVISTAPTDQKSPQLSADGQTWKNSAPNTTTRFRRLSRRRRRRIDVPAHWSNSCTCTGRESPRYQLSLCLSVCLSAPGRHDKGNGADLCRSESMMDWDAWRIVIVVHANVEDCGVLSGHNWRSRGISVSFTRSIKKHWQDWTAAAKTNRTL